MDPALLEALKAYIKENLSVTVRTEEDWDCFSGRNSYQVKVSVHLDSELICEDSDSFSVEVN
jgi:hypothetical protein